MSNKTLECPSFPQCSNCQNLGGVDQFGKGQIEGETRIEGAKRPIIEGEARTEGAKRLENWGRSPNRGRSPR